MNKPNKIIIHHSLTKDNKILSSFESIKEYHITENHCVDIGYHWVIEYINNKPNLRMGRKESMVGAHTIGQNEQSIGICIVGNFDIEKPSQEIIAMLASLIRQIRIRHGNIPIEYHRKYANKTCPGKLFISESELEKEVKGLFDDIKGHWAEQEINKKKHLFVGYPDGTFKPDKPVTRAELAVILSKIDDKDSTKL